MGCEIWDMGGGIDEGGLSLPEQCFFYHRGSEKFRIVFKEPGFAMKPDVTGYRLWVMGYGSKNETVNSDLL